MRTLERGCFLAAAVILAWASVTGTWTVQVPASARTMVHDALSQQGGP